MEKSDAQGQIDRHRPEFHITWEKAIEIVDSKDHEEVNVENQDCCQRERDVSHPDRRVVTVEPEVQTSGIEEDGVDDTHGKGRDAIAVGVLGAPIMASRAEVDHDARLVEATRCCL